MAWAKAPTTAASVAAAACIAAAMAVPGVQTQAGSELAKDIAVKLSVDWGALDAFSAIPSYQDLLAALASGNLDGVVAALGDLDSTSAIPAYVALLNGDPTALSDLDLTSGIVPWATFLTTGNTSVFARDDNLEGGVDLVSAVPEYQAIAQADSAEEVLTALGRLDSTSAIPSYVALAQATSADEAIDALGGIDAFSALPAYRDLLNGDKSALDRLALTDGITPLAKAAHGNVDALAPSDTSAGYAALSAVPAYLTPSTTSSTLKAADVPEQKQSSAPTITSPLQSAAKEVAAVLKPKDVTPSDKTGDTTEKETGSYSAKFEPKKIDSPILFGGGSGGAENGMPGWNKVLNKLGIGGDSSDGSTG